MITVQLHQEIGAQIKAELAGFVPAQIHFAGAELDRCVHCRAQIEQLEPLRCFWCLEPMCNRCWDMHDAQCVSCARTITAAPAVAKMAMPRRTKSAGRPKKIRKCKDCAQRFAAREMRIHRREAHRR